MALKHVAGKNMGDIKIYALSTCIWCKKTKALLDSLGVAYDFVDVDLTAGTEREQTVADIKKWNPSVSFPTIVINGSKSIVGFQENELKKALNL
jgi:glutaredoxin-like protein NrdH